MISAFALQCTRDTPSQILARYIAKLVERFHAFFIVVPSGSASTTGRTTTTILPHPLLEPDRPVTRPLQPVLWRNYPAQRDLTYIVRVLGSVEVLEDSGGDAGGDAVVGNVAGDDAVRPDDDMASDPRAG